MLKFLSKLAEKYAKSTNSACVWFGVFHQPKMPKTLIKED
jgi:cyclic lactone autoinducer peptide